MKTTLSWLREFALFENSPEDISNELSDLGLGVEEMRIMGSEFSGVVTAKVLALRPHPDADRIQLVDVSNGESEVQVCCGAFNMKEGDVVPLAMVGAELPGGFSIKKRKMRGETSEGMLCAASELGLEDAEDGIMVLPSDLELGQPLDEALGISGDVLFDIEVNPNRPDAMSVAGIARDLAARKGLPFAIPEPNAGSKPAQDIQLEIDDRDFCGHFTLRMLNNVNVHKDNTEIARRLTLIGQRPVNSIVDISNYVMLELGQPTHAFDLDLLGEKFMRIRMAKEGEELEALDGSILKLNKTDGLIVNSRDEAISLAGIMGGASTEIRDSTKSVLMEAAWWNPLNISTTSRRLGLRSEASARFERGVDPEIADMALRRIADLAAAEGATSNPETTKAEGNIPKSPKIVLRSGRQRQILGVEVEESETIRLLNGIGFQTEKTGEENELLVQIPSWRPDSKTEIDVIEEVARSHSYKNIPRRVPRPASSAGLNPHQKGRREVRNILSANGLSETLTFPFLAPGDLAAANLDERAIDISNPLVADESVLRTCLRPGLLKTLAYNFSRQQEGVWLFEIGHVFMPDENAVKSKEGKLKAKSSADQQLPEERENLAVILAGESAAKAVEIWKLLAHRLGVAARIENADVSGLHGSRSGEIFYPDSKEPAGVIGEIAPLVSEAFEIPDRVAYWEVELPALLKSRDIQEAGKEYISPSRYPASEFDLAFVMEDTISAEKLSAVLQKAGGKELVEIKMFDSFRGEQIEAGHRSLAFRLRLQAADRTLKDAEVSKIRQKCITASEKLGAQLRS